MAAGYAHTVALLANGRVLAWGANSSNQCDVPPLLAPAAAVFAGGGSTFAIAGGMLTDQDSDNIADPYDNCPAIANPTQADCDTNGIGDACELAAGAPDFNHDTIPDSCQCIADLFVDHEVNGADLGALLAFWGPMNPALPSADINRDGNVNGADLGYLLNAWGPCPN